jgi:threonine aldolase
MGPTVIDLRSDVLAPPTAEMWEAMRTAETGWALVGEDRQVSELERVGAELLGKPAALFLPTCSAANLVALTALVEPGGTVVTDPRSHVATTERGGVERVAQLCVASEGPGDLLVLENTHNNRGGMAIRAEETAGLVRAAGTRYAHLDGARLWNAGVALGVAPAELAATADTVAVSLNKGLCAPYGALLAGPGEIIARARRAAHDLGVGSVHRAGAFAAAGLVALTTMIERLTEDHRRARALADALADVPGVRVVPVEPRTNIVLVEVPDAAGMVAQMKERGVLALARNDREVRFVTHRGIDDDAIETTIDVVTARLR